MSLKDSKLRWFAALSTVLSLVACYGTLGVVALLGMLGTAIAIDEKLWAGAIVAFAFIAVGGLGLGFTRHRQHWPILTGAGGAAVIGYAMYIQYDRLIEVMGFILLSGAAFWDWRICHSSPSRENASK